MLLSIAKLQNLKAIHNPTFPTKPTKSVVINRKTTKFESNSQLLALPAQMSMGLLSIAKLQNLKAIHNRKELIMIKSSVVINRKTTKFESNSQREQPRTHY